MHAPAGRTHLTRRGRRLRTLVVGGLAVLLVVVAGAVSYRALRGPVVVRELCSATAGGTTYTLTPEQAGNAATIAAVAVRRGLPARAATIAIATAVQESKLRNIRYGDRDSVGLFQQRPSQGWGTVEQILDPVYATNAFYDRLVAVHGYETMEITEASHRVQRSAFPRAVADHEPEGRAFAFALTGHSPRGLTCRLHQVRAVAAQPASESGFVPRAAAVRDALRTDFWDVAAAPVAGGTAVRVSTRGDERTAWAVASWAVARARGLDVVSVTTDGVQWRRDEPDAGWADVENDVAPSGVVTIQVASAT
ncbi:MAG: hypothetical protein ACLGIA_05780 [Actinomycetes bacterium]